MRRTITLALIAMLLCSCAATLGRGPFVVPIDSEPRGATVMQDGYSLGVTPCKVTLERDTVVTLTREGLPPLEVDVGTRSNAGLVILGLFVWGPFELIFDAATNAWSHVDSRPVFVRLTKEPQPRWHRPPRQPTPSGYRSGWQ